MNCCGQTALYLTVLDGRWRVGRADFRAGGGEVTDSAQSAQRKTGEILRCAQDDGRVGAGLRPAPTARERSRRGVNAGTACRAPTNLIAERAWSQWAADDWSAAACRRFGRLCSG